MEITVIGDVVKVRADFPGGRIAPILFKWEGQIYRITKINTQWTDYQVQHPVHYSSVEAGGTIYELSFNTKDLVWRLERVVLEA